MTLPVQYLRKIAQFDRECMDRTLTMMRAVDWKYADENSVLVPVTRTSALACIVRLFESVIRSGSSCVESGGFAAYADGRIYFVGEEVSGFGDVL